MSRFIVIEGLDGAGTTTQLHRLVPHLRALATAEPTDGPVGRIARQALRDAPGAPTLDALPWLFAADRADHLGRVILPALRAGQTVISDRYIPSSLAYQSLTLPLQDVWRLNQAFRTPDLVLYVDVDVQTALSRIHGRGEQVEIYDTEERLTAVRAAYQKVMTFLAAQGWPIRFIDGRPDADAVFNSIVSVL